MKIENQVCTLEQGKELLKLGITARPMHMHSEHLEGSVVTLTDTGVHLMAMDYAPAFTVAELGVMLPCCYDTMRVTEYSEMEKWKGYDSDDNDCPYDTTYYTEAQARADMLIHLLENKTITADEVNERLLLR